MPQGEREKMVDIRDLLGDGIHMPAIVASSAEKILGLERLNKAYEKIKRDMANGTTENFFELATKHVNLKYKVRPGDMANIPAKGPVVVVANHPHGLSDGLMFGKLLTSIRQDVRILANEQLSLCKELDPWLIKVDVYEGDNSKKRNMSSIKEMLTWLSKGGLVGIFPAGTASSYSLKDKHVTDDEWNEQIAAIIRRTKATVVPVYFPGRNSLLFQGISLIKKEARVAFLPREVGRDSKRTHKIVVGKPISPATLGQFETDKSLVSHLRLRTYLLGKNYEKSRKPFPLKKKGHTRLKPLIDPIPAEELREEVNVLPEECRYVRQESGSWDVYVATAAQIPKLLREIGRLREITFRAAGEGSGSSCDLDEYDNHYLHLFLWDRENVRLIGAYRMGLTDQILDTVGIKGLYNGEFFHFPPNVLKVIRRGLEMGRAFIVPEYQKRPLALSTIWEGIGQFMARNHQYRYLYGTVSISRDYTNLSRALIVSYLEAREMDSMLLDSGIKAYHPPHKLKLHGPELRILPHGLTDSQNLSQLVADIEEDGKGIPVLLRQYLRLNGKILSFSIDENFGDVLDCLILVDVYKSPERSLKRYLGKEAYEKMLPYILEESGGKAPEPDQEGN